eukprot:COSAG06_NODE_10949_length_1580_cov_0.699933_1_plen_149_part_10
MANCAGVDEAAGYVSTGSCATLKCVNDVWETDPATVLPEGVGWGVVIGAKHASQPPPHLELPACRRQACAPRPGPEPHAAARPHRTGQPRLSALCRCSRAPRTSTVQAVTQFRSLCLLTDRAILNGETSGFGAFFTMLTYYVSGYEMKK